MELFGKKPAPSASSSEQKDALKQRVATEVAMANAQQLISKATENLSSKEQTCLERCLERYFETFNIVSSTYVSRIAAERTSGALNS
ncbi:Tim13p [Malassezia vespertilionis]|uniref:Mitochondrial import inner membrane translocase subunit n=1 Tax=Malassezia vespertilionis TaxID=2020962 RepID=A0A2N1J9X9_9BASI|nr:Tim13p [Malassezia vespertilionis]